MQFSAGQSFSVWLWPIHTGEAWPGLKLLWFFCGLSPSVLYITGVWRWLVAKRLVQDRPFEFNTVKRKCWKNLKNAGKRSVAMLESGLAGCKVYWRRMRK
jgi:uncharacterized iron-regulated membrane protein